MALPRTRTPCSKIEEDCYDWNERRQSVLGQARARSLGEGRYEFTADAVASDVLY